MKFVSFKAVEFARVPGGPITDRFCNFERPIEFEGRTYKPLTFEVAGRKATTAMELPSVELVASNIANNVVDWLEDNNVVVHENEVIIHYLRIDEALTIEREEQDMKLFLQLVTADDRAATFHLGYNLGLDEKIPRETVELDEYPMLRADLIPVAV